jgi:hypothetical protein
LTPPEIPGLGAGVATLSVDTWVQLMMNALAKSLMLPEIMKKATGASYGEWAAREAAFQPQKWIARIRTARQVISQVEQATGGAQLEFLLDGLNDFFGTKLTTADVGHGGILTRGGAGATELGRAALTAMFTALERPGAITPEAGFENAQRLISFSLSTAIEGWLTGNIEKALFPETLPEWGQLDDLVSQNLGLGRLIRRVLAPLLNILMIEPTTRKLNATYLPGFLSEGQAVRAYNAEYIAETEFYSIMAQHGWPRERAALLRVIAAKSLSEADVERGREVGAIGETEALRALQVLGYNADLAKKQFEILELSRLRKVEETVAGVARDMFRDREISEAEYRSALKAAGKSDEETVGLIGLGNIERARPHALERSTIEQGFMAGLVSLSRLRRYYELEGFSLEDQILLEQLALRRKLDAEAKIERKPAPPPPGGGEPLPRGAAEELHRVGVFTDQELAAAYEQLGFVGARVTALLRLAQRRREAYVDAEAEKAKPAPAAVAPRDAIEQAYIRGVVDEGRLRSFYDAARLEPRDVDVLVEVLAQRRAEFAQRREDEEERRRRAAAAVVRPLPQAAAEEAHRLGLTTTADLRAALKALNFGAAAVEQLVDLAELRREAYVDAERRRIEPPPAPEISRSTVEQAFMLELVDEEQLAAYYREQGFVDDDVELLLELARIRKAAADAATAAREARELAAGTKARA